MSDQRNSVVEYIASRFVREDKVLEDILEQQRTGGGPMMNVGPDQGKFLYLLVKLLKPENILEVGSYYGYSSIWLARAVPTKLICVEISTECARFVKQNLINAGLEANSEVIQGSGIEIMNKFIKEKKTFEMIFIDADKTNYPNYLDLAAQLLPRGGLLLADNALWNGDVLKDPNSVDKSTRAIQEFNDKLAASKDFESVILTVQDGLAFAIKKSE